MSSDAERQAKRMRVRRLLRTPDADGNLVSTMPECPHGTPTGYTAYACRGHRCAITNPDSNYDGCAQVWEAYLKGSYWPRRKANGGMPLRDSAGSVDDADDMPAAA